MRVKQPKNYAKFLTNLNTTGISERVYLNKVRMLELDSRHPSLNFELMQCTKNLNPQTWSFRLNKTKWRVLGYKFNDLFQVTGITNHYGD